jgi:hypothetical protein
VPTVTTIALSWKSGLIWLILMVLVVARPQDAILTREQLITVLNKGNRNV